MNIGAVKLSAGGLGERQERQGREPADHGDDADRGAQEMQAEAARAQHRWPAADQPGQHREQAEGAAEEHHLERVEAWARWRMRLTMSAKQQAAAHIQSAPTTGAGGRAAGAKGHPGRAGHGKAQHTAFAAADLGGGRPAEALRGWPQAGLLALSERPRSAYAGRRDSAARQQGERAMDRIALIGGGLIGQAWAIVFGRAEHEVTLYDADPGMLE